MIRNFAAAIIATTLTIGCASFVFAGTEFNNMPKGTYQLDKTHASVTWKVSHLGLSNYTARFTDFDAQVEFDSNDISNSVVTASINPLSVETDYPYAEEKDFNKKLAEDEDWFNGLAFPNITFESTAIEITGENTAVMTGELGMLGVTKPVSFDVTFNKAMQKHPFNGKPTMGFSAVANITRSDWGFDVYTPNIGDEVAIALEVEFAKE